jgi:hypothetical protein
MTPFDKATFCRELIANVQAEILANVDRFPEEWDGHELRRYIADRFEAATISLRRDRMDPRYQSRMRNYRNAVNVNNL